MQFVAVAVALPSPGNVHVLDASSHVAKRASTEAPPWESNYFDAKTSLCGTPAAPVTISASRFSNFVCGLKSASKSVCVGNNYLNRIVNTPNETTFVSITSGGSMSCALTEFGNKPMCWGVDGGKSWPKTPVNTTFVSISTGRDHACGIMPNGTLDCWGANPSLQTWPVPSIQMIGVSSGGDHTCALTPYGKPICWGLDTYGQTEAPDVTLTTITAGVDHTCGLDVNNFAVCWGKDNAGQVSMAPKDTPLFAISAGDEHTCGLKLDENLEAWRNRKSFEGLAGDGPKGSTLVAGTVVCWGKAVEGGEWLGEQVNASGVSKAGQDNWKNNGNLFVAISAGKDLNCAQAIDGEALCWGNGKVQRLSSNEYYPFLLSCAVGVATARPPPPPSVKVA